MTDDPKQAVAPPKPAESDPDGEITGVIQGDRVCIQCGFNLHGQRIVRESKYNLLIARCPECGQAAALQEYPLLGRWSNRWAAALAGLWLVLFLVLSIGTGMLIFGLSVGTTEISAEDLEHTIAEVHNAWVVSFNPDAKPQSHWEPVDIHWWEGVDKAALFGESGGVSAVFWRSSQTTWIALFFAMLVIGCFGSVALLGVSRVRQLLAVLFPIAVASAASILFIRANITTISGTSVRPQELARLMIWEWTFPTTIALGGVFLVCGMLLGRPLARLIARIALPDRFAQALAVLWTADGKQPPGRSR